MNELTNGSWLGVRLGHRLTFAIGTANPITEMVSREFHMFRGLDVVMHFAKMYGL